MNSARTEVLDLAYASRSCFVCAKRGWCPHREPEVEMAFAEALERRARIMADAQQMLLPGFISPIREEVSLVQ
jgi:hypothetical protein